MRKHAEFVEPNSALGDAINYLLKRWHRFTLFLRQAGTPLDNNVCELALKTVESLQLLGITPI
ncbi:MAG: transposase [Rhodopirellula sp.]|nr:transposase [Rhodopirellula sp.]